MNDIKVSVTPNDQGELVLRNGEAKPVFDYRGFTYKADGTRDFAALVGAKAPETDSCIVFFNDSGFKAILDDRVQDRPQDRVVYSFQQSVQMKEWADVLGERGKVFGIKDFADFLKRREEGEIQDLENLLYAVQNFKYVTNIEGDFTFEDRNNYTFNVKVNEAETTVRVPKVLVVSLEIFKGSGFKQDVEIEIEVHRPKDPSEKPGFLLSCPKFGRYHETAKEYEFSQLAVLLEGYLVVAGSPE